MSHAAQVAAGEAMPECGRYELLKDHEDNGVPYHAGEVLEFTCEEVAFLKPHGVIWAPSPKPVTRKRLLLSPCAGCGAHLVSDADAMAADAAADTASAA
jgi:hypothetical protein